MGQLFLWQSKIDEAHRSLFLHRFGFDLPGPMEELFENLPEEFFHYLGFYSLPDIVSEERRPAMMMPGLIPFGETGEGDLFCLYLSPTSRTLQPMAGVWLHETNHFLPVASNLKGFFAWWLAKEILESTGDEEEKDLRRLLELFEDAADLASLDLFDHPPASALAWHQSVLSVDPEAAYSLAYLAVNQFAVQGIPGSMDILKRAEAAMPFFGAGSLWQARFHAMRGQIGAAHDAYFRHLRTPLFANGYHYLWHIGDLLVPEMSETEAIEFFDHAEIPPPSEIARHRKVRFLRETDPGDFRARLKLAEDLERAGDHDLALVERENAFFLQSWDDSAAREMLESLVCIYPEHNRLREAEQCRRALSRLRLKSSTPF